MKKTRIVLTAVFLFVFVAAFAQTEKGNFFVGISSRYTINPSEMGVNMPDLMTIGFSTVKFKSDEGESSESVKFNNFNLNPKIGYFAADNLLLGIDMGLGFSSLIYEEEDYESKDKGTFMSVGPFVRYYLPMEKITPFAEASVAFGTMKSKWESEFGDDESKSGVTSFHGGVGFLAKLGSNAGFEMSLGYLSNTIKDKDDNPENYRMVVGSIGVRFGLVVFLGAN